MKSIAFPNIFKTKSSCNIVEGEAATLNNLMLLVGTEKNQLFGDPFWGIRKKRYLFEQNNGILKDILIDELYTQIQIGMPQIYVQRRDISINQDTRGCITATIRYINKVDGEYRTTSLVLFDTSDR